MGLGENGGSMKNHYQGDARPVDRVADFKDENA